MTFDAKKYQAMADAARALQAVPIKKTATHGVRTADVPGADDGAYWKGSDSTNVLDQVLGQRVQLMTKSAGDLADEGNSNFMNPMFAVSRPSMIKVDNQDQDLWEMMRAHDLLTFVNKCATKLIPNWDPKNSIRHHPLYKSIWEGQRGRVGIGRYAVDAFAKAGFAKSQVVSVDAWDFATFSTSLFETVRLMSGVFELFPKVDIPFGASTINMATQGAVVKSALGSEIASGDPSTLVIAQTELTGTVDLSGIIRLEKRLSISREAIESNMNSMQGYLDQAMVGMARGRETALFNGDTSGTHMDDDTNSAAATVAEKRLNGIIYQAIQGSDDTYDAGATDLSVAGVRGAWKKISPDLSNPAELVLALSHTTSVGLMGDSSISANASGHVPSTIATGGISPIHGIQVIRSVEMRDAVAATGVDTSGGPNTFSRACLFNRFAFHIGQRPGGNIDVMVQEVPGSASVYATFLDYFDFQKTAEAALKPTSTIINLNP